MPFIFLASNYYPQFAEVLYNFSALGPQELGVEKGALVEIVRKESGPWWYARRRIKKTDNNVISNKSKSLFEFGWLPKDFVRVITSPYTDQFYLSWLKEQNERDENNTIIPSNWSKDVNTGSSPYTTSNGSEISDQSNVTTIVIESSPANTSVVDQQETEQINEQNTQNDGTKEGLKLGGDSSVVDGDTTKNEGDGDETKVDGDLSINLTTSPLNETLSFNMTCMDNADILRRSAIKELLDTEVNYVRLLSSICEG